MKINFWFFGFLASLIAIMILSIDSCNKIKKIKSDESYYKIQESLLQTKINEFSDSLGAITTQYSVLEIEYNDFKNHSSNEKDSLEGELKKAGLKINNLLSHTRLKTKTVDTLTIRLKDTIKLGDTIYHNKNFSYSDKFIDLSGKISFKDIGKGLVIEDIGFNYSIMNEYKISYVYKRRFLRKKELVLNIYTTNPNTSLVETQTYVIKNKNKFYETWWFNQLVGLAVGVTIGKLTN